MTIYSVYDAYSLPLIKGHSIHRLPRDIPDDEILCLAKWDRLDYVYKRKILSMMHKISKQTAPKRCKTTCSRDKLSFELPQCFREIGRTSIRWRGLPINLRSIKGIDSFKNELKSMKELSTSVSLNKEVCLVQKTEGFCLLLDFYCTYFGNSSLI